MSCEHASLKLKSVPGPATRLVCAECGIRAESVVEILHGRWKQSEAAAGLLNELVGAVLGEPRAWSEYVENLTPCRIERLGGGPDERR